MTTAKKAPSGKPPAGKEVETQAAPAPEACKCECECEYPFFARQIVSFHAMQNTIIYTVLGRTAEGKMICYSTNTNIRSIDPKELERVS